MHGKDHIQKDLYSYIQHIYRYHVPAIVIIMTLTYFMTSKISQYFENNKKTIVIQEVMSQSVFPFIRQRDLVGAKNIVSAIQKGNNEYRLCVRLSGDINIGQLNCSEESFIRMNDLLTNHYFLLGIESNIWKTWGKSDFLVIGYLVVLIFLMNLIFRRPLKKILNDIKLLKEESFVGSAKNLAQRSQDFITIQNSFYFTDFKDFYVNANINIKNQKIEDYNYFVTRLVHDLKAPVAFLSMIAKDIASKELFAVTYRFEELCEKLLCEYRKRQKELITDTDGGNNQLKNSKETLIMERGEDYKVKISISELYGFLKNEVLQFEKIDPSTQYLLKFHDHSESRSISIDSLDKNLDILDLKNIISNLLKNSQEALAEKIKNCNLRDDSSMDVSVSLKIMKDYFIIAVSDCGIGVCPHQVEQIKKYSLSYRKVNGNGLTMNRINHLLNNVKGSSFKFFSKEMKGSFIVLKIPCSSI